MTGGVAIPLHLVVHVLGLTVAFGLTVYAVARRDDAGSAWFGLALGGVLLGVAHLASGALFATDVAWPVYARAAGYAAIAVGGAGRLATVPVVAVAPIAAHVAAAIAGVMAAVSAVRGVLGRTREAFLLGAGLVLWAAADLVVRTDATIAGFVSAAGSVAVGGWLIGRASRSLLARFAASFLAVLLLLVVGLAAASGLIYSTDLQRDQLRSLQDAAVARAELMAREWPQELLATASLLGGDTLAREFAAVADGTVSDLDSRARNIAGVPGVDVVLLVNRDGRVVGSADAATPGAASLPRSDELLVAGDEVVREAIRGARNSSGVLALGERDLLSVGAVPVAPTEAGRPQLDRLAGALVLGRRISDPRVVSGIEALSGADAAVVIGNGVAASTLSRSAAAELVAVLRSGTGSGVVVVAGSPRFLAVAPVVAPDGTAAGEIALMLDATALAGVEANLTRSLFWAALAGLVVAALLAAVVASRTTRPIRRLTDAAEQVASGDLDVRVQLDRQDEVGRLAGAFDEMTGSLKQREQDLRAATAVEADLRRRLEVMTGSIGEALVAVDGGGRIQTANRAAARLLGIPVARLVGQDIRSVLRGPAASGESLVDALGGADAPGAASARGAVGRGARLTPVAGTAAPLEGEGGERLGRVYVLRDITGEIEVERMKTEFLANISHELRTPLTPIKGYAEVLRSKDVGPERTAEFARNIVAGAARLERVIAMLVDFASLEAGRVEVKLEPTDLSPVVDRVLERWRDDHPDRRFSRRIARRLPAVQVDPALLARVLEELVDNAVKFSDGPVALRAEANGRRRVRVTVHDRGQGIDAGQLDSILSDFHQADGSATRRHGGLGLGLSIVQRIVERFGGEIVVESEVGEGTEVHLLLPVAAVAGGRKAR